MTDLKPCPFCGGEAQYRKSGTLFSVHCTKCHLSRPMMVPADDFYEDIETEAEQSKVMARDDWNGRYKQPTIDAYSIKQCIKRMKEDTVKEFSLNGRRNGKSLLTGYLSALVDLEREIALMEDEE